MRVGRYRRYQKYTQEKDGEKRESFIYYAPCLVKDTDDCANKFESWAKEQDFLWSLDAREHWQL